MEMNMTTNFRTLKEALAFIEDFETDLPGNSFLLSCEEDPDDGRYYKVVAKNYELIYTKPEITNG